MSIKTTFLTLALGAFLALPAGVQAADDNGGFGAPFANAGHAGFETPSAFEDDGSDLQTIEPAAGETTDIQEDNMGLMPAVTQPENNVMMREDEDASMDDGIDTLGP